MGKKRTTLNEISCAFCSHGESDALPLARGRMHEWSDEGCIRITGLRENSRGQIDEGGGVVVLAGQQIRTKG